MEATNLTDTVFTYKHTSGAAGWGAGYMYLQQGYDHLSDSIQTGRSMYGWTLTEKWRGQQQ